MAKVWRVEGHTKDIMVEKFIQTPISNQFQGIQLVKVNLKA